MDTNPFAEVSEAALIRTTQISKVAAGGLREVMGEERIPQYLGRSSCHGPLVDLCMDMAEALGSKVFIDQSEALKMRPDQHATLKSITVPVLVLCGEEDQVTPVETHKRMHDLIAGSRLEIIADAGHLPTVEQAGPTNKALRDWLKA